MILNERMTLLYCFVTALADGTEGAAFCLGGQVILAVQVGAVSGRRASCSSRQDQHRPSVWETSMHASNTAAWRAKVREASDGIEAVKKELGTGRLHPETIIFAEGQGSALSCRRICPFRGRRRSRRSSVRFHGGLFESPLTDSNRRPPPYRALLSAIGRNRWQRFWLVFAAYAPF